MRVTLKIYEKGKKTPRIVKQCKTPGMAYAEGARITVKNPKLRYTVDWTEGK